MDIIFNTCLILTTVGCLNPAWILGTKKTQLNMHDIKEITETRKKLTPYYFETERGCCVLNMPFEGTHGRIFCV